MGGVSLNSSLMKLLMCDDIQPGTDIGYQTAKTIYLYHPLGRKMVESPITMAQSQRRVITVQEAPDEVIEAFEAEWNKMEVDKYIHNLYRLSRIYGIASLVALSDKTEPGSPLDMTKIWDEKLSFNVLDPLNTAGSLVLDQIPTSPEFNRPITVRSNGKTFHPSRFIVAMNEEPVYLAYTNSAFGFVGRSVYQRALYALKSFVRSMIADDMVLTKLGLLIAKQKSPGSIINRGMEKIAGLKRHFLKEAQTGNVLSIDVTEDIETLNMTNVEKAGTYARGNCLKNVATAADMPAVILENETMTEGFGEGTEDAKIIAAFIDSVRIDMNPSYRWFDNIVQYRAWNQEFYKRIQAKYPNTYGSKSYEDAFSQWRDNYKAVWPSYLREPDSQQEASERTKLEAVISVVQTLIDRVDPENRASIIQTALMNISENKRMFPHEFVIDYDTLLPYLEEQQEILEKQQAEKEAKGSELETGERKKMAKFE
jgi:hypothetical protein